jgi:hypothetical protein
MDSETLTEAHAKALYARLDAMHAYIVNLQRRMEICKFPTADPLMVKVVEAKQAMQELIQCLHELAYGEPAGDATTAVPPPVTTPDTKPEWMSHMGKYPENAPDTKS